MSIKTTQFLQRDSVDLIERDHGGRSIRTSTAIACLAWVAVACSSQNQGDGTGYSGGEAGVVACPVRHGKCSGPAPSYATDVAPILDSHCVG